MELSRGDIEVESLEKYAKQLGYNTCYTNSYNISHVNLTRKCIFIKPNYSLQRQHQFAHEIGHIILFKHNMTSEVLAWIVGLYVCVRCKVELKGFIKEAIRCLKTYIK